MEEAIMIMEEERKKIVEFSKKMLTSGLTKGTAGNISIYNKELGYMAISPSGIPYEETMAEDIVVMDLDKNIIEGHRKPSSECDLHIELYKAKDTRSVVHTHSMYCTVLACLNQPLKAIHYVLADAGVSTVPVAPYRTYGTKELADAVCETIGTSKACLMANHGMIACGSSIESAFSLAATCEWVAEVQWKAMSVGSPIYLSDGDMEIVKNKFKGYGQKKAEGEDIKGYFG